MAAAVARAMAEVATGVTATAARERAAAAGEVGESGSTAARMAATVAEAVGMGVAGAAGAAVAATATGAGGESRWLSARSAARSGGASRGEVAPLEFMASGDDGRETSAPSASWKHPFKQHTASRAVPLGGRTCARTGRETRRKSWED